ncbi:MAG: tetratricopeptide repeat protein [Polyangiaceae bacterium]|nr:tetratricopeptide repeat protein [Polyangiaceae bacterium]
MTTVESERARVLFQAGRFVEAERAARRLLAEARQAGDAAAEGRAHVLLGEIAYDGLRYDVSQQHLEQAVALLGKAGGEGSPGEAGQGEWGRYARSCQAVLFALRGPADEADRAIEAAREGAPPPSPELATLEALLWVNVTLAEVLRGRLAQARHVIDDLWHALEPDPSVDRALLGTVALQRGVMLERAGEHASARALFERSLSLRTEAFGAENYRCAAARLSLAGSLLAAGRRDEAVQEASAAIDTIKRLGLDRYAPVSAGYATLGAAALLSGRRDLATRSLEVGAALEEKTFGAASVATASMLVLLASSYAEEGNWGKVAAVTRRALPPLEASAGPELEMATELHVTGLTASGRAREAGVYAEARLSALRGEGASPKLMAMLTWAAAQGYLATGNVKRAEPWLLRARATAVAAYGEASVEVTDIDETMRLLAAGYRPRARNLA